MASIIWKNCAGQHRVKEVLGSAMANNTLGHAYLFSGEAGCGKFAAALDVASALLCENGKSRPCGACDSCAKVAHYAHPDFHIVMPVALAKEHKSDSSVTEEGWTFISDAIKERMADVYSTTDHEKVPEIPVDWVRETNHTIIRGPLESAFNVVIIDGVDTMRKESANGMLKILEEPRAGTVMLLLTDRFSAVLPTIVSRCQIMRFSWLTPAEIREEMVKRLSIDAADLGRLENVIYTGSLGRSLRLWKNPPDAELAEASAFWDLCAGQNWTGLAELIDRIGEWNDFSRFESLFMETMVRIRNAFLSELPGTENVFLGGRSRTVDFVGPRTPEQVEKLCGLCQSSITAVRARANITLVLANFAIALTEALRNGEKQQPG
jgi:DNA polymerase III delta' subunit